MICIVEGCTRTVHVKKHSLCRTHYGQYWRGVAFTVLEHEDAPPKCRIEGCTNKQVSSGLCGTCYGRKRAFNLSDARLEGVLSGVCEICGAGGRLTVDHDHSCCPDKAYGKTCGECVRGYLCNNCNTVLGVAKDSIESLESMIAYLQSYPRKADLPIHGPVAQKMHLKGAHCAFPGCGREIRTKGLCKSHYSQKQKGYELSVIVPRNRKPKI